MHATAKHLGLVIALTVVGTLAVKSQTSPTLTHAIEASINGSSLIGTADIGPRLTGKSAAEQRQIFDQAVKPLVRGEAVQLVVAAVASNGMRADFTGSPRLRYVDDGCLSVGATGLISVVATSRCVGPSRPTLVVALLSDDLSTVVGLNEYFFAVAD